ncbi:Topoisomerase 1-associated factor 1 [Dimargaris verticillata]|uniref:Topoisomerase 1-associated factor 1 n=1 Tax=Dimargaris verticillata TaxID=2761393 RepID=A0A9W8B8U0_9FUNG|nr:Topoisomerase 1-associated factor 1 [Dimargaris verticillata]
MDSDLADWQEKFKSQVFSVCSALGGFEQIALAGRSPVKATTLPAPTDATSGALQYVLGDECLDCLKDLKRYIRQDETNPAKHVLGWLGEWSILQRDLLPLLEVTAARLLADNATHTDVLTQRYSHRMAAVCISALELLVVMTWYVDKDERGEAPWFDRVLCGYKLAFATHPTVIAILLQLLVQALAIPAGHRSARDRIIVNGVLLIYRNLLEIPDPHVSITASGELITHGKLQEMLIETFHRKDIYDLMLTFASSADERELLPYNLIIHDILYFSFKDVHPEELFRDASQHAMRITDRLMTEKRQAKLDRPQASISRHSRFGGTYAVQSPTGQVMTMLTSQTFTQPLDHTMDDKKTKSKRVKAPKAEAYEKLRHPFQDHQTFTILARVAKTYLESGFNTLAASVREDIERERAKVKAQDATRFMYTTAFFMQTLLLLVNHQEGVTPHLTLIERPFATTMAPSEPTLDTYGFELIGSMVSLPAFALVVRNLRTFYEEKRWAEMHTGVRCFLQLLRTLIRMSNSAAEAHREVADHMFQNLCYEAATLDLLGTLVRQGDNHTFDQSYLTDLVELMHLFLRVLEHYAQEKQHMFVRKKQRVPRSAKPSNDDPALNGAQHAEADASDAAASADDDSARYTFVEREFELTQCERDLARESVINTYSTLLKQYRELPSMAVYWIVTMFQRLAIKQGFEGLFFKASTRKRRDGTMPIARQKRVDHRILLFVLVTCTDTTGTLGPYALCITFVVVVVVVVCVCAGNHA